MTFHHSHTSRSPHPSQCPPGRPCPQCHSTRTTTRNFAQKYFAAIGTLAGVASGAAGVMRGAQIGWVAGSITGPVGTAIGTLAGAALGALVGGALGCEVGVTLGKAVDNTILDNHECLDCHHRFSPQPSQPANSRYGMDLYEPA